MDKLFSKIGFISLMLGCAGIESENMMVPAAMAVIGSAIIGISVIKENSSAPSRPK